MKILIKNSLIRLIVIIYLSLFSQIGLTQATNPNSTNNFIKEIDDLFNDIIFDDIEGVKKKLLKDEMSPNTIDKYGNPAIVVAARESKNKVLKFLSDSKGINLELTNKLGENALMFLSLNGNLEFVRYLVNDKHAAVDKDGWTALHYAATKGHLDIVKFLVSKDADIDSDSPNNTTPLMMAARYGHIHVVKFLLDNGADLSAKNTQDLTAIDLANKYNQNEIRDGLISRWKKIYGRDYQIHK
jgi:ankyrin repeat protein